MTRPLRWATAFAAASLACISLATAADFPTKPIKLVVPYPAGGNADGIARVFSNKFADEIGGTVIVDNKPGASGTIGADAVAKAAPDGYTLLLTVTSQLTSAGLNVKPNYDGVRDFVPVVGLNVTPLVFAVSASSSIKSMKDLVALAKTKNLAYGSYGAGTSTHIMQYLLSKQIGAKDMVHIPYKGEAPMVVDMLGGQIDMGLVGVGTAREMEKSGKMRPLALVGLERSEFLPDVPTFKELGYKDMDWTYGVAVYAPSKMPAPLLEKIREAGKKTLASPDVQKAYRLQSNQPWSITPAQLQERMVYDSKRWTQVLGEVGKID